MIVAPDADRGLMVSGVLSSAFGGAGQRCLAGSVAVLVGTAQEQDAALGAIVEGARALKVGAGLDESTDVCPVVSPAVRERLEGDIAQAEEEGARVLLDGRGDAGPGGCQLGPTVLDLADTESRAAREELFGPVLSVVRVPDLDAAIEWSNGSTYGNSAILFTSSGGSAQRFRQRIEAGMLGVNIGVAAPVAWFPFARSPPSGGCRR